MKQKYQTYIGVISVILLLIVVFSFMGQSTNKEKEYYVYIPEDFLKDYLEVEEIHQSRYCNGIMRGGERIYLGSAWFSVGDHSGPGLLPEDVREIARYRGQFVIITTEYSTLDDENWFQEYLQDIKINSNGQTGYYKYGTLGGTAHKDAPSQCNFDFENTTSYGIPKERDATTALFYFLILVLILVGFAFICMIGGWMFRKRGGKVK